MTLSKYTSFPESQRYALEAKTDNNLAIQPVEIKNPNTPALLEEAIWIKYWE